MGRVVLMEVDTPNISIKNKDKAIQTKHGLANSRYSSKNIHA
jgi:hypothetical protein